jgi:hypothetical protein
MTLAAIYADKNYDRFGLVSHPANMQCGKSTFQPSFGCHEQRGLDVHNPDDVSLLRSPLG